jgi:N-carbamoylputrescine amidase
VRDKFTVGLVQMSCGPEPGDNHCQGARPGIGGCAQGRRTLSACPNSSRRNISASAKMPRCSILPSRSPEPGTEKLAAAALKNKVVLIASLFEKRAPGVYHNTAAIFDSDGALGGIYRKMHIPDDPLYYEKFYFTPGDLGFKASIPPPENSARSSAGTSGIPKARA